MKASAGVQKPPTLVLVLMVLMMCEGSEAQEETYNITKWTMTSVPTSQFPPADDEVTLGSDMECVARATDMPFSMSCYSEETKTCSSYAEAIDVEVSDGDTRKCWVVTEPMRSSPETCTVPESFKVWEDCSLTMCDENLNDVPYTGKTSTD
ncbi:hypothetical protein Pmani_009340 [Petrolisthes manimaculis]|uniref:Uncharacterized protein n=1 Tax=Petrolisthes manimaculis TaxID=1843537 RepID=A0AAE1Q4G1_9EUCA|nr:hypothetical protein Pmani_009340 [Petrolisthes manimaculis]